MIEYKKEITRKFIHISSLWIPILYLYSNTATMLKILFPLTIIAIVIETTRKYSHKFNGFISNLIGSIMRDEERNTNSFAGATHLFISSTLTIAFFNKEIAIFSLLVLVISDSLAALVGRKLGWIKIYDKSLIGSLSFAASSVMIYYYVVYFYNFSLSFTQSMIAIFIGTIAELFAKKMHLDDNFAIPLAISIILVW